MEPQVWESWKVAASGTHRINSERVQELTSNRHPELKRLFWDMSRLGMFLVASNWRRFFEGLVLNTAGGVYLGPMACPAGNSALGALRRGLMCAAGCLFCLFPPPEQDTNFLFPLACWETRVLILVPPIHGILDLVPNTLRPKLLFSA